MRQWILTGILVVGFGMAVQARPFPAGRVVGRLVRDPALAEEVGLDQNEVTKLRKLYFQSRRAVARLEAKLRLAQIELEEARVGEAPDVEKLDAIVDRIGALRAELQKQRLHFDLEVGKLLGADRWVQVKRKLRRRVRERLRAARHHGIARGPRGRARCAPLAGKEAGAIPWGDGPLPGAGADRDG